MIDCYASVVYIYKKICYFEMCIIFQFKLLRGENKNHWNNEGVDIPNILIRHMLAMRLQLLLIYFFLNG